MHPRSGSGLAIAALVLSLVVSGCSSGDDSDGPSSSASSRTAATPTSVSGLADPGPASAARYVPSEAELTQRLAGVGIETYADAGDAEPVVAATGARGPLQLTGWQLQNMRRHLASGEGYRGRDLDELTAGADAVVPIAVLLAAWASKADTPRAQLARKLMGARDYVHDALDIVYPDAVVALFVDDIAADVGSLGDATSSSSASPAAYSPARGTGLAMAAVAHGPAMRAGSCSALVGFLTDSLSSIVEKLTVQIPEGGGVLSVLATVWDQVVVIAAAALKATVKAFTSTFLGPISKAIALVAVLSSAADLLNRYTITAAISPADSVQPGTDVTVTETVDAGVRAEWPADLKDCAATLAGVTLPDIGDPAGSEVKFRYADADGVAEEGAGDTVVNADGQAVKRFSTLPQEETDGVPVPHIVTVDATVDRPQVDKLLDLVQGLLISGLPKAAQTILLDLLSPLTKQATDKLKSLLSHPDGFAEVQAVTFTPNPTPVTTPHSTATPTTCALQDAKVIPDGHWRGPININVTGSGAGNGPGGSVQTFTKPDSMMSITVKNGEVTGTWKVRWRSLGNVTTSGITALIMINGEIHGGVGEGADQPRLSGNWHITGPIEIVHVDTIQLDERGFDTERLHVDAVSCDHVDATFLPSFNSKNSAGSFTGSASWTGTRVP